MESSRPHVILKDNFEVILGKTDTELKIEAKDQGNGQVFLGQFSIGAVKQMTNDLFENIPDFFEELLAAFEGRSDETTVKVTQDGRLLFAKKLMFGKQEKTFNLTIPLKPSEEEEEEEELSGTVEEQIQKLFREVKQLKKGNRELKKENLELKNETRELKERLGCNYELTSPDFDVKTPNVDYFTMTSLKSVTRNKSDVEKLHSMSSVEKLSRSKNTKFFIRIDNYSRFLAVGITLKKFQTNGYWFTEEASYCVIAPQELRINRSSVNWTNRSRLVIGSIVGILFIPKRNEIEFDIDGRHVYTAKLELAHQNLDFYPTVSLRSPDDCVTFLGINHSDSDYDYKTNH